MKNNGQIKKSYRNQKVLQKSKSLTEIKKGE